MISDDELSDYEKVLDILEKVINLANGTCYNGERKVALVKAKKIIKNIYEKFK